MAFGPGGVIVAGYGHVGVGDVGGVVLLDAKGQRLGPEPVGIIHGKVRAPRKAGDGASGRFTRT